MKRLVCLFLALFFVGAPAARAETGDEARSWAAEQGLPRELLDMMWDDLLLQIYDQNHEAEELSIAFDTTGDPHIRCDAYPSPHEEDVDVRLLAVMQSTGGIVDKTNIYIIFKWDEDARLKYRTEHISFYYDNRRWGTDISHSALTRVYGYGSDEPYIDTTAISWANFQEVGQSIDIKRREGPPYGVVSFTLYPVEVYETRATDGDFFSAGYTHNYQGQNGPFGNPVIFTIPWWLVAVILVLFHWLVWKIRKKKRS